MNTSSTSTTDFPYEEFASLIGATAPGTSRNRLPRTRGRAYFRNGQDNFMDINMVDALRDARPSGVVLPKVLRQKLLQIEKDSNIIAVCKHESESKLSNYENAELASKDEMQTAPEDQEVSNILSCSTKNHTLDDINAFLPKDYKPPPSYQNINRSHVFTASELEMKLVKANEALADIQKQLYRGEELYFQETDGHGNLYKGWDAFIDSKADHLGIEASGFGATTDEFLGGNEMTSGGRNVSSGGGNLMQSNSMHRSASSSSSVAPTRRMPVDHRWFSSSSLTLESGKIVKGGRRSLLNTRLSSTGSMSGGSATSSASVSPVPSNTIAARATISTANDIMKTSAISSLDSSVIQTPMPQTPILSNVSAVRKCVSPVGGGDTESELKGTSQQEIIPPQITSASEVVMSAPKPLSKQPEDDEPTTSSDSEKVRDTSVQIVSDLKQEMNQEDVKKSDISSSETLKAEKGTTSKVSVTKEKKGTANSQINVTEEKNIKNNEPTTIEKNQKKSVGSNKPVVPSSESGPSLDLTKQSIPRKKKKVDDGYASASTLINSSMKGGLSSSSNSPIPESRDKIEPLKAPKTSSRGVKRSESTGNRTSSRKKSRKRKS